MKHLYLYFSGTGNTKYVVEKFAGLDHQNDVKVRSIETLEDFDALIMGSDVIVIGYPIYGSMMPFIMSDFLKDHAGAFSRKKIITIATQLLFSGDGGALAYRLLRKQRVILLHSIHVNMPNNIADMKIFPIKTIDEVKKKVDKADQRILEIHQLMRSGKRIRHGIRWYSRALGFFLQRSFVRPFFKEMLMKLTIDHDICVHCNKCVEVCPTHNLEVEDGLVKTWGNCTICYRCVNLCPVQAITLLGKKKPDKQYIRDSYH